MTNLRMGIYLDFQRIIPKRCKNKFDNKRLKLTFEKLKEYANVIEASKEAPS